MNPYWRDEFQILFTLYKDGGPTVDTFFFVVGIFTNVYSLKMTYHINKDKLHGETLYIPMYCV